MRNTPKLPIVEHGTLEKAQLIRPRNALGHKQSGESISAFGLLPENMSAFITYELIVSNRFFFSHYFFFFVYKRERL